MRNQVVTSLALTIQFMAVLVIVGDEPKGQLGKPVKELLNEEFDGSDLHQNWKCNTGKMAIQEGALRLSELAADKHIGAFRYALPMQDMLVRLDFQFDGAKVFHLGFDPAPGQLPKKGHLYNVIITPSKWSLVENNDKANPDSKPKVHAQGKVALESKKWYTLTLENKGEELVATIRDIGTLQAKASDFKVKKPALVFRAGGDDTSAILIDNLTVTSLE